MKTVVLKQTIIIGQEKPVHVGNSPCPELKPHSPCKLYCPVCEEWAKARNEFVMTVNRLKTNAPCEGFVIINELQLSNVGLIDPYKPDNWIFDAFLYAEEDEVRGVLTTTGRCSTKLTGTQRVFVAGKYTGKIPEGMKAGDEFTFEVTLSEAEATPKRRLTIAS